MKKISIGVIAISALLLFGGVATSSIAESKNTISQQAIEQALSHQKKGDKFDDKGEFKNAITEYIESLKYNPDDPTTLFNLGVVYLKVNQPPDAVGVFERLNRLLPSDPEVCNLMGVAYSGSGKKQEAIKSWEKSLSLQPEQEKVKEMLTELKKTCAVEEKK